MAIDYDKLLGIGGILRKVYVDAVEVPNSTAGNYGASLYIKGIVNYVPIQLYEEASWAFFKLPILANTLAAKIPKQYCYYNLYYWSNGYNKPLCMPLDEKKFVAVSSSYTGDMRGHKLCPKKCDLLEIYRGHTECFKHIEHTPEIE